MSIRKLFFNFGKLFSNQANSPIYNSNKQYGSVFGNRASNNRIPNNSYIKYGIPEILGENIVKYGIPEEPDFPIVKYGIPEDPKSKEPILKYGIPEEPEPEEPILKYGIPEDPEPEEPILKYGIPEDPGNEDPSIKIIESPAINISDVSDNNNESPIHRETRNHRGYKAKGISFPNFSGFISQFFKRR
jgi:hypothetical protein